MSAPLRFLVPILVTVLVFAAAPVRATGALAGEAALTSPGCAASDVSHFVGTNAAGNEWKIQVSLGCATPKLIFIGPWDPASGGCIDGSSVNGRFCMGAVPIAGVPTLTTVSMCIDRACQSGEGVIVRA